MEFSLDGVGRSCAKTGQLGRNDGYHDSGVHGARGDHHRGDAGGETGGVETVKATSSTGHILAALFEAFQIQQGIIYQNPAPTIIPQRNPITPGQASQHLVSPLGGWSHSRGEPW